MQILEFVKMYHMFITSVHKTKINVAKNRA